MLTIIKVLFLIVFSFDLTYSQDQCSSWGSLAGSLGGSLDLAKGQKIVSGARQSALQSGKKIYEKFEELKSTKLCPLLSLECHSCSHGYKNQAQKYIAELHELEKHLSRPIQSQADLIIFCRLLQSYTERIVYAAQNIAKLSHMEKRFQNNLKPIKCSKMTPDQYFLAELYPKVNLNTISLSKENKQEHNESEVKERELQQPGPEKNKNIVQKSEKKKNNIQYSFEQFKSEKKENTDFEPAPLPKNSTTKEELQEAFQQSLQGKLPEKIDAGKFIVQAELIHSYKQKDPSPLYPSKKEYGQLLESRETQKKMAIELLQKAMNDTSLTSTKERLKEYRQKKITEGILSRYVLEESRLIDLHRDRGGNCVARSSELYSDMVAAQFKLDKDEIFAFQTFNEHIELVVWNKKTNKMLDIFTGNEYDRPQSSLVNTGFIYGSWLEKRGHKIKNWAKKSVLYVLPRKDFTNIKNDVAFSTHGGPFHFPLKLPMNSVSLGGNHSDSQISLLEKYDYMMRNPQGFLIMKPYSLDFYFAKRFNEYKKSTPSQRQRIAEETIREFANGMVKSPDFKKAFNLLDSPNELASALSDTEFYYAFFDMLSLNDIARRLIIANNLVSNNDIGENGLTLYDRSKSAVQYFLSKNSRLNEFSHKLIKRRDFLNAHPEKRFQLLNHTVERHLEKNGKKEFSLDNPGRVLDTEKLDTSEYNRDVDLNQSFVEYFNSGIQISAQKPIPTGDENKTYIHPKLATKIVQVFLQKDEEDGSYFFLKDSTPQTVVDYLHSNEVREAFHYRNNLIYYLLAISTQRPSQYDKLVEIDYVDDASQTKKLFFTLEAARTILAYKEEYEKNRFNNIPGIVDKVIAQLEAQLK